MISFLLRRLTEGSSYAGLGIAVGAAIDAYATGGWASALPAILGGACAVVVPDKGSEDRRHG